MKRFYEKLLDWDILVQNLSKKSRHCCMLNKDVFKKYDENFMKDNQNAAKMEIGPKERPYFVPRDISFDEYCNDRRYPVLDKLWVPGRSHDNHLFLEKQANVESCKYTCQGYKNFIKLTLFTSDLSFPPPKTVQNHGCFPYYLLDMSSLLPVLALRIQPDDKVLDMCASPGGKTVAMKQLISESGLVVSNDFEKRRYKRLLQVIQEYTPQWKQNGNVIATNWNGIQFGIEEKNSFDKILVDAPCSSERHVIQNQFQYKGWSLQKMKKHAELQYELVNSAVHAVKPGGTVVYSTCSMSPIENDDVIRRIIQNFSNSNMMVTLDKQLVEDTIDLFPPNTFSLHDQIRNGVLVLPTESHNWGPLYYSRITRLC